MDNLSPVYVDYTPDPKRTNGYIKHLQHRIGIETAQELATDWASYTAAISFVLRRINSRERVHDLMSAIVDDACNQYEAHQKAVSNGLQQASENDNGSEGGTNGRG